MTQPVTSSGDSDHPPLLDSGQAAARLGISAWKLGVERRAGRIAAHKFGHRTVRFSEEAIAAYLRDHATAPQ